MRVHDSGEQRPALKIHNLGVLAGEADVLVALRGVGVGIEEVTGALERRAR